jgi:hypothetical protein
LDAKFRFWNTPTTYFQLPAEFKHWTTEQMVDVLHARSFGKPQLTSFYFYYLGCITACCVGWESYDYSRCSVLAIIGIFKFQFYIWVGLSFKNRHGTFHWDGVDTRAYVWSDRHSQPT